MITYTPRQLACPCSPLTPCPPLARLCSSLFPLARPHSPVEEHQLVDCLLCVRIGIRIVIHCMECRARVRVMGTVQGQGRGRESGKGLAWHVQSRGLAKGKGCIGHIDFPDLDPGRTSGLQDLRPAQSTRRKAGGPHTSHQPHTWLSSR